MNCLVSGRLGDVFHALYVVYYRIQELGGPTVAQATLYVSQDRRFGGEPFGQSFERTLKDLEAFIGQWCPYIREVISLPDGQDPPTETLNLNQWRTIHGRTDWITSLNHYYKLSSLNLSTTPAWCFPKTPEAGAAPAHPLLQEEPYAVIHRSLVRHNPECPWNTWIGWLIGQGLKVYFITASVEEYEAFPWKHLLSGGLVHCPTLCEMSQWIYHAQWFLGNQSSPLAMNVALGKRCLVELNPNLLDGICYMNSTMSEGNVFWFYQSRRCRMPEKDLNK
jgi:hypothetical protein